jgi:hypothetical protein
MMKKGQRLLLLRRVSKIGIELELDQLREYADALEDFLAEQRQEFASNIQTKASQLPEEQRDEVFDFYQDDYWKLAHGFPTILRTSLFVTCCSMLEYQLTRLCEYSDRIGDHLLRFDEMRGPDLEKAKKYLKGIGVAFPDGALWQKIWQYKELRNVIVHYNGQLSILARVESPEDEAQLSEHQRRWLKKQKQVENFIKSNPSISLYGRTRDIQFSKEFCLEVIDTIDRFFRELFQD